MIKSELNFDIIKFVIMYLFLTNIIFVWQITSYFNNLIESQNENYSIELSKVHDSIDSIGSNIITERTIYTYEVIPVVDEFAISEQIPLTDNLQEFVYYLCQTHGLDYHLVIAMIDVESGFDCNAISNNNYGLMQINKINHDWILEDLTIGSDFLNPYNNVVAGCYMLSNIAKNHTSFNEILLVYNLGETGANRLFNQGIFETYYSEKVREKYYYYGGANYVD